MQNTYDEIRADLQYIADYFEDREITYKAFNNGIQFNAMDDRGVWHSFYPTTGTVIIHRSNDRKDHEIRTFYNKSLEAFTNAMFRGEALQKYFK